jgi:hypothetical protein
MKNKKSTLSLYQIFRIDLVLVKFIFFKYDYPLKTSFYAGFLFLKFSQYSIQINNRNSLNIFNSSFNT